MEIVAAWVELEIVAVEGPLVLPLVNINTHFASGSESIRLLTMLVKLYERFALVASGTGLHFDYYSSFKYFHLFSNGFEFVFKSHVVEVLPIISPIV
ncbi:MAG TPA: hypothetical protein DCF84_07830 [Bacteroidetes bacterium]|nr:hypothetical protein [Bacteroidota bacterium]